MYSVVLATMLTAGGAAPDGHGFGGCHCACSGCWGNAFSSCRGCGGCYGCWGCSGCRGCSGCWGGAGCYGGGGYGAACFGCTGCVGCACYGSGCWGCAGCAGCAGWGCSGCGCSGGHVPPAPAPAPKPERKEAQASPARITVHLPADAKLTVDGVECPLASDTRAFETPKLQPGQQFYYTVRAEVVREGKPVTETRRVIFTAGAKIDVEFRLPVETASR